jgi:hypothetical protein
MENNGDLISRSALIAEHCSGCDVLADGLCDYDVCGSVQLMMEAPAVDAVVVVRCKDCVWGIVSARNPLIKWCNKHATHFRDNDFCSYGERRGNDGK